MYYVDNGNITDPRINLAMEEHLLRNLHLEEPILLFYVNEPSVIIGRNQNTVEEIDPGYVKEKGIHVVRRISGGGAVYHDLGNLNFSFITPGREDLHNFTRFTDPVIRILGELGVEAELRGRSDIFAGGKKISGNAQYATSARMFSHGTLLFDTDIREMLRVLNPKQAEIESKAVQSIRNFVTNIRELLPTDMNLEDLKQALLEGVFGDGGITTFALGSSDWEQINQISSSRYASWEWNYGRSPRFNIRKRDRLPAGEIDARLNVERGVIQGIRIFGSYAGDRDVSEIEARLVGVRHDPEAMAQALEGVELKPYFGDLEKNDLVDLLY